MLHYTQRGGTVRNTEKCISMGVFLWHFDDALDIPEDDERINFANLPNQ